MGWGGSEGTVAAGGVLQKGAGTPAPSVERRRRSSLLCGMDKSRPCLTGISPGCWGVGGPPYLPACRPRSSPVAPPPISPVARLFLFISTTQDSRFLRRVDTPIFAQRRGAKAVTRHNSSVPRKYSELQLANHAALGDRIQRDAAAPRSALPSSGRGSREYSATRLSAPSSSAEAASALTPAVVLPQRAAETSAEKTASLWGPDSAKIARAS